MYSNIKTMSNSYSNSIYPPPLDMMRKPKKEKKMNWFRKKFAEWSRQAWKDANTPEIENDGPYRQKITINGKTSVHFSIYPASGGYVIEHYKQDRFKDNEGPSLTIVSHDDSIGTAVEHIITMEALKS